MDYITLEDIKDKLDFFYKMYDVVRLVDPIHKKVLDYRESSFSDKKEICYHYWGNNKICDNCISVRSHRENECFVKLERRPDALLLITAIPIKNADQPIVLELLKNATDHMDIGEGNYNEGELFSHFVKELNDVIVKDPLTSLYNRRFIDERLPIEIIDATLAHIPISICFMDLDEFKSINDLYGHETGDLVIKAVGRVIRQHISENRSWAARYGGDEFIIYLYNTHWNDADILLQSMKQEIENVSVCENGVKSGVSVSYGIETMHEIPMTAEEIIRNADEKMYRVKKSN